MVHVQPVQPPADLTGLPSLYDQPLITAQGVASSLPCPGKMCRCPDSYMFIRVHLLLQLTGFQPHPYIHSSVDSDCIGGRMETLQTSEPG